MINTNMERFKEKVVQGKRHRERQTKGKKKFKETRDKERETQYKMEKE